MLRNKIGYAVFLVILLVLAILYNRYFTLLVFAVFLVLPVILLLANYYVKSRLSFSMEAEPPVIEQGKTAELAVRIENRSIFPVTRIKIYMSCRNRFCGGRSKEEVMLSLDSGSIQSAAIDVSSDYAGNVEFSIDRIYIYDLFRLWRTRVRFSDSRIITVLPAMLDVMEELPRYVYDHDADSGEYSKEHSGDDVSELFDVREYRQGDQYKRMHRKLSLKMDELYIKEFGLPVDCSLVLMADFRHSGDDGRTLRLFDKTVSILYSLAETLIENRLPFYLVWFDGRTSSCRRERIDGEEQLFDALAQIFEGLPDTGGSGIAKQYMASYPRASCLSLLYVGSDEAVSDYLYFCDTNTSLRESRAFIVEDSDGVTGWRMAD